ncbi:hypothetical protein J437_LFUL012281 [Ladona fulva]|uniref:PiggyBac transposable element-derived protein domain-containing protein n=1 Tax=Ladona fulva TaxID=123851 RepID=A0A8K0P5F8_LADFU|nr:hypothetical protein J437_LFUL012281 [Ladona fulva]
MGPGPSGLTAVSQEKGEEENHSVSKDFSSDEEEMFSDVSSDFETAESDIHSDEEDEFPMASSTVSKGTLRANRKGNPCEITSKILKRGEWVDMFTEDGICVLKWKDRRDVIMKSSEFDGEMTKVTDRRGNETSKPQAVLEYNKSMGGVDLFDQMRGLLPMRTEDFEMV